MGLCIRAGYDNAISFSDFDDTDIKTIENCAWEKASDLLELSEVYSSSKPSFIFLPGHRKLLLSLPKAINSFTTKKRKKNLFQVSTKEAAEPIVEESIELLTENELIDLKSVLVEKLNKSARAIGLSLVFSENSIVSDIETYISNSLKTKKFPSYRCLVKCCFCDKRIPCTHNSTWQISNLESHLKVHIKSNTQVEHNASAKENFENAELNAVLGIQTSIHSSL